MRLYLIRHAQSTNNVLTDLRQRTYDPDLTDLGYQQAQHLATYLAQSAEMPTGVFGTERHAGDTAFRFTHLYCSAMQRTLLTTQPLAQALGLQPQVWLDLHEIGGLFLDDGEGRTTGFGGITRSQAQARFPGYHLPDGLTEAGWWPPEHGEEKVPEFLARAIRVSLALRARARSDDRIALVTHGAFMNLLIKAFLNQLPGYAEDLFYAHYNTAITRLDFEEGDRLRLHYLNRFEHLPADMRSW
jgi:broad specificity phosphatase PhoE